MKTKTLIALLVIIALLFAGCTAKQTPPAEVTPTPTEAATPTPTEATTPTPTTDAVTTPSIVNNEAAFLKAISKDGTWIICTLNDLTINQELVLEGQFTNKDLPARKIALYAQDADRKVTARYTLKAPKLTVKSENARIQGGTFVGDVYVEAKGFSVVDGKVEGNVYFASEDLKATFKLENGGTVTGATEVKK